MLVSGWCNQYHPAITTGIAAGPCDFSVETITENHYRCSHTPCIECRRPKWRYDPTASKVRRIRDADRRGDRYTPAKRTEHDMFGKPKENPTEAQPSTFTCAAVTRLASRDLGVSSISSSITIVGKISGKGTVRISGRIEGELYASTVLIDDGAQVEGDIVAEELTIGGRVKGTIHAHRVKLIGSAVVEGDIFHRSLSIDENARFEGSSRREETVTSDHPTGSSGRRRHRGGNGGESEAQRPARK